MFRPQIQKTSTLFIIALFNVLMVYLSVNSMVKVEKIGYNDRLLAAENMYNCIKEIQKVAPNISEYDIYNSGLIGVESSAITTVLDYNSSMLDSKVISTNPNFAAFIIEMLYDAELEKGDTVAVSMTGSFPGANIAFLSACKAMDIIPIIISSTGSSSWGANTEDFSWPVIENHLYNQGLVDYQSIAYSMGGANDNGDNLSDKGIEIFESVIPDKVIFINNSTLDMNIKDKMHLFRKQCNNYVLYVNIGGGAASLGSGNVKDTLKVGLVSSIDLDGMILGGFKNSIAHQFLHPDEDSFFESIPMINIKRIKSLIGDNNSINLSNDDMMLYQGSLYYSIYPYNPKVILLGLFLSILIIISVGIYSHKQIKRRMETHEIDSII